MAATKRKNWAQHRLEGTKAESQEGRKGNYTTLIGDFS